MYNVHVTLTTRENSEYPDFASIEFSGWPSDVDRACERFQQLMAYAVPNESVAWPELVETMLVPLSAKPAILGEKAVTLRGIMKEFSVFLTFKNGQIANGFVPLAIRGLSPGIARCKQAISDIIRDPAEAETFREDKPTQAWPTTEHQAAQMGVVAADEYIPQAYVPAKKFIPVTHGLTQARFGRYGDDYEPPADAVRMCESDFEGISPDAGPLEALIRLELTEFLLTKTIAEGDTERSTALQLKLLNLCDCLLDYFNDERGRTVPPEKNVLLLKGLGLNPNFGHYEVAQLFEVPPRDIILWRTNADDLVAGKQCYCVFKTAEDASRKNSAEAHAMTGGTAVSYRRTIGTKYDTGGIGQ
ncbi:hypothetical protein AAVH_15685 [Aphelenchoides avenae]|nr:hypothetical protein AAVH_15685 [Aphelenchus avenae]